MCCSNSHFRLFSKACQDLSLNSSKKKGGFFVIFTNVSRLCKERGVSIARLERDLGIGNATIRNWNVSSPTVDRLKLVADYFGVTLDELLTGNPTPDQEGSRHR